MFDRNRDEYPGDFSFYTDQDVVGHHPSNSSHGSSEDVPMSDAPDPPVLPLATNPILRATIPPGTQDTQYPTLATRPSLDGDTASRPDPAEDRSLAVDDPTGSDEESGEDAAQNSRKYERDTDVGQVYLPVTDKNFKLVVIGHEKVLEELPAELHDAFNHASTEKQTATDTVERAEKEGITDSRDLDAIVGGTAKHLYTSGGSKSRLKRWGPFKCKQSTARNDQCKVIIKGFKDGTRRWESLKSLGLSKDSRYRTFLPATDEEHLPQAGYERRNAPRVLANLKAAETVRKRNSEGGTTTVATKARKTNTGKTTRVSSVSSIPSQSPAPASATPAPEGTPTLSTQNVLDVIAALAQVSQSGAPVSPAAFVRAVFQDQPPAMVEAIIRTAQHSTAQRSTAEQSTF